MRNFITLKILQGHGSEKLEKLPKYIEFITHDDVSGKQKIQIGFWKNLHSDFNWVFTEVEKDEIIDAELHGFLRLYVAFFGDINCNLALMFSMDGINFKHSAGMNARLLGIFEDFPKYIKFSYNSPKKQKIQIGYWKH